MSFKAKESNAPNASSGSLEIQAFVDSLIGENKIPKNKFGESFAPANIALCKYWGKRESKLNLPETNSLSISLGDKGTYTQIECQEGKSDHIILNNEVIAPDTEFAKRLSQFLNYFREPNSNGFKVNTTVNIPIAAGLASSASGFAALVLALNRLYGWNLDLTKLSLLARVGSGSACRSLWHGFVEWEKGHCKEGSDSHGVLLQEKWPDLRLGIIIVNGDSKKISSRMAMEQTRQSSHFYSAWREKTVLDCNSLKQAIKDHDFIRLGEISEANARALHALMMTAHPSIVYIEPDTLKIWQKVESLRKEGVLVYFTQDAGPNVKLLFLENESANIMKAFPSMHLVIPFKHDLNTDLHSG